MKSVLILFAAVLFMTACSSGRSEQAEKKSSVILQDEVPVGIQIGQRAPELVFKSPEGKKIALTSLRGKVVLIDFWASWCAPCRKENPNLVKLYKRFKDKEFVNGSGFTIYGVSIDKSEEAWVAAIEKDGLEWETHVSDLKGSGSVPAAMYGVMGIPMNFLIDGHGIIVAKGLRGEYLEEKLKELIK